MGGGIPLDSSGEEDGPYWARFAQGSQSPWAFDSGFEVENEDMGSSSNEKVLPASVLMPTFAPRGPKLSPFGSRSEPEIPWNVESEVYGNDLQSGGSPVSRINARENQDPEISETPNLRGLPSRTEETVKEVGLLRNISTDPKEPSLTPYGAALNSQPARDSVQQVRKSTFKLMQIVNDNQDLSFVEKVILSREEIFDLCNNITAGSAKSSEGRRVIDFKSLDSKSMKVVGFFGSKLVMRDIFQKTKFREQRDIWMQIQNDTLAPGLYAWLEGELIFVFYWHQGHSLPEASRKDMSCNFIRYVFDLCDTVCVCLESENLKNSIFENAPRFAKHRRTQRLQISLVKASEDSVKVMDGFLSEGLSLGGVNALPAKSKSRKVQSLEVASGHDYKMTEGVSRVALLFSSNRPPKLSSFKEEKVDEKVSAFPAFLKNWTEDKGYSLNLKNLSDSDFVVFIRAAGLKAAVDFDKLVDSHRERKEDEKDKRYRVDLIAEKEQRRLTHHLEDFIDLFLKAKHSRAEGCILDSGVNPPLASEDMYATRKSGQKLDHQWSEQGVQSYLLTSTSLNLTALNQFESELSPPDVEKTLEEVTEARSSELEHKIYDVLLDENSQQRMVFPNFTVTHIFVAQTSQYWTTDDEGRYVFTVADGPDSTTTRKLMPISYGDKVVIRSMTNVSAAKIVGTIRRHNDPYYRGPIFTEEEFLFRPNGPGPSVKMTLKPARRTGDLSEWLNRHVTDMGSPGGWKHVALLIAVARELADSEREKILSADVVRETLFSENPLDSLQTILSKPVFDFARRKWDELRDLGFQSSADMHETAIAERVKNACVEVYEEFRTNLVSRICPQVLRFTTSLLYEKVRKQNSENYERLEASLKREEAEFLASQKASLSQRKDGAGPLTLTVERCRLIEKSGSKILGFSWKEREQKLSVNLKWQEFEKESITWHGLELAPMKADLDHLITDNDYAFSPSCSASQEIIDLDPNSQALLKVVFLKAGKLLVFIAEGHHDSKDLRIYLCPKLGVKLSENNLIKTIRRGFDLIAFDENSRYIAMYDSSIATIKTFRFDETFRHMDWTGVDIALGEYSIGRLTWMDFVTGKNEIVFIDDLYRMRLCDVNQPGMVRSGNIHIGQAPVVKACVTTQGSCLLLLRKGRTMKSLNEGPSSSVRQQELNQAAESGDDSESEGLKTEINLDSVHPSAERKYQDEFGPAPMGSDEQIGLTIDVYKLADSIEYFSSIPLDTKVKDWSNLVVGLVSFSSQMHLVIFDSELPSVIVSKIIKISSASEVCKLEHVTRPEEEAYTSTNPGNLVRSGPLDYIYQVFEKYATSPPLNRQPRGLHIRLVLKGSDFATTSNSASNISLSDKCVDYVNNALLRLTRDKGKDFSAVEIHVSIDEADQFRRCIGLPWSVGGGSHADSSADVANVKMGTWMRKLICLVPIQIARAEHNAMKPMNDGLQLSGNVDYVDAISLANVMRFGLYEAVFDSWTGPVKVISSMGKQSSGKSYLLNHLSGSLLDVAGGRCTDGVWMSLRQGDGCLYVLLDFEGLGSFERSEQEDMLLSMLNAAISNLTIFNKKDFHLDKETEAIFERFQNGVSLVKTDAKLFRGLFYMAIKDVDIADVEDLKKEFFSKISQICSKSQDNFLTKMYGGQVEISAMPSFNRAEFHESIADIARTVEELDGSYLSGRSFLLDLKLIIAQISTKDWSPIDSKRIALRVNLLRKHLQSAVSVGCFFSDGVSKPLIQFDDHVEISDEAQVTVDKIDFPVCDTALELTTLQEKKVTSDILLDLLAIFKRINTRNGEKDDEWHSYFERFLSALVVRRKRRVLQWIAVNTSDFFDDGDVQKLHLEAVAMLAEVQQNLLLCSCKCERCFSRCVQEKGHPSSHSCVGDHRCAAMCTYCLDEESTVGAGACNDVAGHDGPHDCKEKSHTCGKCCTYANKSSNCNGNCSKKSGHSGEHQCNSRQHTCNQLCSLPSCKNPCVSPIDVGDHDSHACHEKFCPLRCTMTGCNRTCATEDHFHSIKPAHHFCGSEHPCLASCEQKGNCEVLTEVSKKTQTFTGLRATFDYVLVSEQNGNRKGCCMVIPPFKDRHEGPHSHTSNPDAVHFCETRCPSCGYFCNRPMEHGGLHDTTHGNMRDVSFVAESEEIDIQDRKYAWGESGVAEMCQMHCKAQGRGHIHLAYCPANQTGGTCRKVFDGTQHEVRKYGPEFDVPKDEMTHTAFWDFMRFEDPCSAEEKKQFALCSHQCKSEEHNPASGVATSSAVANISYCTEALWHQPIPRTDMVKFGTGYITDDGHHFSCDHSTNVAVNVIFVIYRSGSMDCTDIRPSMTKFSGSHNNRLGCVYEAILRFIRTRLSSVREDVASVVLFDDVAATVVSLQEMKESLVDELVKHGPRGSTTYSSGLQGAEKLLSVATTDARLSRKCPVVIFLSDGGNNGGSDPLYHIGNMKALDPKLQLHTIMFGHDPARKILEDMAKAGDGTFEVSLDEVQLSRRFEGLAKSLRPQVASLL